MSDVERFCLFCSGALQNIYFLNGGRDGGGGEGGNWMAIQQITLQSKKKKRKKGRYKMKKQHKGVQHCLKYELQLEKQRDQHFSVKYLEYVIYVHTSKNRKQKTQWYTILWCHYNVHNEEGAPPHPKKKEAVQNWLFLPCTLPPQPKSAV